MKKILAAVSAVFFLFFISVEPKIFMTAEKPDGEKIFVACADAKKNLPLVISFIHSVQKTPVIEELKFDGENFILLCTKYKSHGVGLPFMESDGKFFEEDGWFVMDEMNRTIKNLSLRTGVGTKLCVTLNGVEYKLYKKFPPGTKITISVQKIF